MEKQRLSVLHQNSVCGLSISFSEAGVIGFACQGGVRSPSSPAGVSFSLALRPSLTGRLVFFGSPLWHQAICYWGLAVLGVSWEGSEVPCCPTIGNLRSPSPGEDGWFPLAGLPWRPPRGA